MHIERDLERIAQLAKEREDENWEFRSFLKFHDLDSDALDAIVHELNEAVSQAIDCTECGNCCKQIRPIVHEADSQRLTQAMGLSVQAFRESYLTKASEMGGEFVFHQLPCPFLENNKCIHYEHRPNDCASYPHLHKPNFASHLMNVIDNYAICPIVFNVYEQLKERLGFHQPTDFDLAEYWDNWDGEI